MEARATPAPELARKFGCCSRSTLEFPPSTRRNKTACACSAVALWFAENVGDPLGRVFLRTLFFVVIPLVFASLHKVLPRLQGPERIRTVRPARH